MAGYIKPRIVEFVTLREPVKRRRNALIRVIKAQALWDTSQTHSKLTETELSVARAVMLAYYTTMES